MSSEDDLVGYWLRELNESDTIDLNEKITKKSYKALLKALERNNTIEAIYHCDNVEREEDRDECIKELGEILKDNSTMWALIFNIFTQSDAKVLLDVLEVNMNLGKMWVYNVRSDDCPRELRVEVERKMSRNYIFNHLVARRYGEKISVIKSVLGEYLLHDFTHDLSIWIGEDLPYNVAGIGYDFQAWKIKKEMERALKKKLRKR